MKAAVAVMACAALLTLAACGTDTGGPALATGGNLGVVNTGATSVPTQATRWSKGATQSCSDVFGATPTTAPLSTVPLDRPVLVCAQSIEHPTEFDGIVARPTDLRRWSDLVAGHTCGGKTTSKQRVQDSNGTVWTAPDC